MDARKEIRDVPRTLKESLEKGRPEFEALVRRTRWGEGPLFLIGSGSSYFIALTGASAFEGLLGWPAIARRAEDFVAYSASLIRPRSVVLAISTAGDSPETLEAAREARSRGAALLALTAAATSPLAEMADGVFLVRSGEETGTGLGADFCLQAAMGYIGLVAARTLKRHHQKLDDLDREFEKLPDHAEWVLTRLSDALRSCAQELKGISNLALVGGGFYYPAALHAAWDLKRLTSLEAGAHEAAEFHAEVSTERAPNPVWFLSGSRCRLKKIIHDSAKMAKGAGGRVFAVTDANDRELADAASLAVLLPALSEMSGSTLGLLFVQALACQISRDERARGGPAKPRA